MSDIVQEQTIEATPENVFHALTQTGPESPGLSKPGMNGHSFFDQSGNIRWKRRRIGLHKQMHMIALDGRSIPSTFLVFGKNMLLTPLPGKDARSADLRVQAGREPAAIRNH